jgi:hypothetical protein
MQNRKITIGEERQGFSQNKIKRQQFPSGMFKLCNVSCNTQVHLHGFTKHVSRESGPRESSEAATEQFSTAIYRNIWRNAGSLSVNEYVCAERPLPFALAEIKLYSSPNFHLFHTLQKKNPMRVEMAARSVHTFFRYVLTRNGYVQCTTTVPQLSANTARLGQHKHV